MTKFRMLALVTLGGAMLAACSDGGGSSGDGGPTQGPSTFAELDGEAASLLRSSLGSGNTPLSDMPTAGSASYDGVMALGGSPGAVTPQAIFAEPELLGDLSMTANFGSGTVSGTAADFRAADGSVVGGLLSISDGDIDRTGFRADVDGTLTQDGIATLYDGTMVGNFFGADADSLAGSVAAVARTTGELPSIVRGAVVAD